MKLFGLPLFIIICLAGMSLSISITVAEGFLILLLIFLAVYLYKNKIDITVDCPYFLPFFAYWFSTILSVFLGSPYTELSGNYANFWPLLYLFIGWYFVSQDKAEIVFAFLLFAAAFLAVSACYDVFWLKLPRGFGVLKSYMSTGNILALASVASLGFAISKERSGYLRSYYFTLFILIFVGLISTGTRGALLASFFGAAWLLIARYKLMGAFGALLLIASAVAVGYHTGLTERFEGLFGNMGDYNSSHGWRILLWKNGVELFKEYPIFGIGPDAFKAYMVQTMPVPSVSMPHSEAHNGYLQQLVSFGLVGFAAFLWFYGRIVYEFIKESRRSETAFVALVLSLVYFTEALTESLFSDSKVIMFYAFFTGVALAASKRLPRF